ncbi:GNAT family N-acetyltransferase [Bacillus spongiae]|uniref:GNAT family N-acetyltransferase n=1 Tax=Bacillus spongiae TaxID=2683610 RepID=A0ABU8HJH6_9BACI
MKSLTFIKDFKKNPTLRHSFNDLATQIFGINFEEWYQKGFWNDRYIPFSYVEEDKVIANVSVNILDMVVQGEVKNVIQIGTVMTHPHYRNQGLSTSLMNKVLQEYEDKCDFFYLFANQDVLEFYPKFGFETVNEYQYSMQSSSTQTISQHDIQKLDGKNPDDLNFISRFASERVPTSNYFSTINAQGLLMFYCIYVFNDHIYYLKDEDIIIIYEQKGNKIDIYDIISKNDVQIHKIINKITNGSDLNIVFHYTPNFNEINTKCDNFAGDDVLFVKPSHNNQFPSSIKHPLTSKA